MRSLKKKSALSPISSSVSADVHMGTMWSIGWKQNDGCSHDIKGIEEESLKSSFLHDNTRTNT